MKRPHILQKQHTFDVCVVGGGLAGMIAAISAARNGARTAIIHDRPVFGGNASSEIRMWICGASGAHHKEAGLLEEIQLENMYRNPGGNYSLWDGVLFAAVHFQPGLEMFLNCSCTGAQMEDGRISSIEAWQLTTQIWHTVRARTFIDCSGDSILAAVTGADFRVGREGREEFGEDIQPEQADGKTMGNSLLIQLRRTGEPQPFISPAWAYKFRSEADLPHRANGLRSTNFWWIEVGGLQDTIRDAEKISSELTRITYGVWDYIKNHAPERATAQNWAIEWIGSLPGKRESRRYLGDHVLTQNDIRDGGRFDDIVAYGGWAMDDHHPAGIFYPGKPTIFHPAPSPYGIPYRCLYSRNIANLMFAGRNISVTHAALSSTRVMGTCALLGQAAGTAAALCVRHACDPRDLTRRERLRELQQTLMEDDCWLPGLALPVSDLAQSGRLTGTGTGLGRLLDGITRDLPDGPHAWIGQPGGHAEYIWSEPRRLGGSRLVFDSNFHQNKRMPCSYPQRVRNQFAVPNTLVRKFRLETRDSSGSWSPIFQETNNYQRLVHVTFPERAVHGLRLVAEETWGANDVRVFGFEPLADGSQKRAPYPDGPEFSALVARMAPEDLAPMKPDAQAGGRDRSISA